ncbi:tubulin-like doman-containing protein [Paenibacillus sp. MZ04-78.2]|uniref:tubulin-like doman-containing protein n=1 Tax=Paenibacillus sp. MZ04-78.2 TaxID=2962034 RepID=UPI0020B7B594|nr:tubulin-like doman-containing protein [Paenibacillus sp. MZ04-78.2]MCP3774329.1 tubulin-like doman-containing protein [Paenibacillus sp. MZ04-78.2]
MKAVVREHIQQLDVSLGGGIVSEKIRVDTIDNPMLVIGLGGTGIDALLRLKYQVNRRFRLPEDPFTKKKREKPDNIEFLAFETNEHDRNKRYKGIGLDPMTEFVLLSNAEIGSVLQNRSILEPYMKEWLSPELTITDGINGASGVRQAGRLLLFTKIVQVVQTIERKIKTLSVGTNKKLMVFLLTGISGGTGSGCFLDIAYIVRGILERDYGSAGVDKVGILGYLFTPDVNLANKALTEHSREYIKKNGYAALKELDYWMNVDERGDRFKQQYANILTVNSPMPPFNLAHLISATNLEGKQLENAYDYCMNVTAENITNFMASEQKQSGEEFAIHDYISNIRTNINQMPKTYAANYQYNILGASSAVLPIEEMTTFLAYKVFQRMSTMFEAGPSQEDVEKLAHKLGLDPDSIHREFDKNVPEPLPGYQNSERLSYNNVVKQQIVHIDTELEQSYLSRAREEYIKSRKQLPGQIREVFAEQMGKLFRHPEQGPFYVSRIVLQDKGFCLLKLISSYIESLKENVYRIPRDIEAAGDTATQKLTEAKSAFISKDKKKDAYIEAKIQEYLLHSDRERIEQMIEFYEDLYTLINNDNSRIYQVFTEILNELNKIFQKNGDILTKGQEEVDHKGNRTYYWNIVSVPDMAKLIGDVTDEKNVTELIRDFTQELLEKSNQWIKEQEVDVVSSISEFLTEQFSDLITKSMEDFLIIKYGHEDSLEKLVEQKIAGRLYEEAKPVFHLTNSSGHFNFPSWGFVSVPVKAPNIFKGIRNFQDTAIANSRFTIKESEVKNRVFWLNTQNGIPLFLYTPLKVYEESYERSILEPEGVGRHLVQNEKTNWTYLPSPIPEKSWGDTYENARVKHYNAEVRSMFDQSLALRIIREKSADQGTTGRYECVFTKPFDLEQKLASYPMQLDAAKPNLGEIKRCVADLKALVAGGLEQDGLKDIFGSVNEEMAKENLIRSPEMLRRVREELGKYRRIEAKIAELEQVLAAHQDEEKFIQQFIEAMYTGAIMKKGALYVYDHEAEEDPWEPFVNLMQAGKFPEYEIYRKIRALDAKRLGLLQRKSSKLSQQLTAQEDISGLLTKLQDMAGAYQDAKSALDYDRGEYVDGEDMYQFYKQIASKVSDILRSLK